MRSNEFITEANFLSSLGKGAADFAKGFGALSTKDHETLTKNYNKQKFVKRMTKVVQQHWSKMVLDILASLDDDADTEALDNQIRLKLGKLLRDTLKMDPGDEVYHDSIDAIIDLSRFNPTSINKNNEIRDEFAKLIAQTVKIPKFKSQSGSPEKVAAVRIQDHTGDIVYIKNRSGKFISFKFNQSTEKYKKIGMSAEDQKYVSWAVAGGKYKIKPMVIIRYSDNTIVIDDGSTAGV